MGYIWRPCMNKECDESQADKTWGDYSKDNPFLCDKCWEKVIAERESRKEIQEILIIDESKQ